MRYDYAFDLQRIAEEICSMFFPHVKVDRLKCFRSYGSSAKRTIARCHTIGKLMQKAMAVDAFYAIEFLMPIFEKQSHEDQIKTIIHELMHIPKTFGGGFRQHDYVCEENVDVFYRKYLEIKRNENQI